MYTKGFSLVEIIIVMAIMLALIGLGFFIGLQNYFSYGSVSERNLLTSILLKARNEAVNNFCLGDGCTGGMPHGVKIVYDQTTNEIEKYVLFQGESYDENDPLNQDINANYHLSFIEEDANPISEVWFEQLSGLAHFDGSGDGTLELSDRGDRFYSITINSEGRIDW